MALTEFDHALAEVKLERYLEDARPPENIRSELDLGYRIENQSIIIFEIRPHWQTKKPMHIDVAKTTFVNSQRIWMVYWMRQDGQWHRYEPVPEVKQLDEWIKVVEEDEHCCFWG